jgi:hypothetical protein
MSALQTAMFTTAVRYASELNWSIVPVWWIHEGCCACGDSRPHKDGKHPIPYFKRQEIAPHGYNSATTDLNLIERWWTRCPRANIGIATGKASGLVVLDVDIGKGGMESLEALISRFGPLPVVPTAVSGSGGRHFYFTYEAVSFPHTVGDGLDVLSDGRGVVAPFSYHKSGGVYRWERAPW